MKNILVLGMFCLIMAGTKLVFSAEEKQMVGYWKCDEGEGEIVKDSSGKGNDGKIQRYGEYAKWVEGRAGKALEFSNAGTGDGNGRDSGCVTIPAMGKYDFSKGLTVEAWVKLNKNEKSRTYEIVTNTVEDRGPGFRFRISYTGLELRSGEGGEGEPRGVASYNPSIKVQVWCHVAGTYDGSMYRIYLNGEQVGESKPGLSLTKGRDIVTIGAFQGGAAYGFEGIIGEVKIFNYARSPLEILKDFVQ
ncbi:MAG: LamG domain-containing protein [Candidatus Omnitrophota bacterium]